MKSALIGCVFCLVMTLGCRPDKPASTDEAQQARTRVTAAGLAQEEQARESGEAVAERSDESSSLSTAHRGLQVAKVGDVVITLGDLERRMGSVPAISRERYAPLDKKVEFLDNLIQFELVANEAQRHGYDTDPDVVFAMKRAMIQKYMANDLQERVKASRIEDAEVEQYYNNNRSLFVKPEEVRVSHILFPERAAADTALEELQSAIQADPARARTIFSRFARMKSKDLETAHLNGDMGFFSKAGYSDSDRRNRPKLSDVLIETSFGLKRLNDLSVVVEDERGFHILQITNRRPGVNRSLEKARRQITNILLRQKKDAARVGYIEGLKKNATITKNPENLKLLKVIQIPSQPYHMPTVPDLKVEGVRGTP